MSRVDSVLGRVSRLDIEGSSSSGRPLNRVESARLLVRDTTRQRPGFPCKEARNEVHKSAHVLGKLGAAPRNIADYKIVEQETRALEMTLEAEREASNQRDSPFTIATKCGCFALVII